MDQKPLAAIIYLDVDDEITSAASRIRSAPERRLALVLPGGSRVATSRINFRLLAREAAMRGRELAVVTPEGGTRALAASAGLPVFASVAEYEDALAAGFGEPESELDAAGGEIVAEAPGDTGGAAAHAGAADLGRVAASSAAGKAGTGTGAGAGANGVRGGSSARGGYPGPTTSPAAMSGGAAIATGGGPRAVGSRSSVSDTGAMPASRSGDDGGRRRFSGRVLALTSVLIVLLLIAGAATWLFLPSADVTVAARVEPVGPVQFTVRADPLEVTEDAEAGVIPAEVVTYDLSVSQDFPATGKKISETKATGSVTWTNCDPTRPYTIPDGTVVRTADRQEFATDESVFLPVAILTGNPPTITCQSHDVPVTAKDLGPAGNVATGAITVVPSAYNPVVIRARNRAPTTGGTHTETKVVTQKDVDAAVTALTKALREDFTAQLSDPSKTPSGLTLFPATRSMSSGEPTVAPDSLVGQTATSFTLGMDASGTATAVDTSRVEALGEQRIRAAVSPGRSLVSESLNVAVGPTRVDGSSVVFAVTAGAQQATTPDTAAIRQIVKGLSVDAARERLRDYGDATIDLWPGWVSTITPYDFRLGVNVLSDVSTEPSGLQASPRPTAAASPSGGARPTSVPAPSASDAPAST